MSEGTPGSAAIWFASKERNKNTDLNLYNILMAVHVARIGKVRNGHRILVGNP